MPLTSPAVILYDASGNALAVQDGALIPANTPALLVAGYDPGNLSQYIRVAADGTVRVDPTGTTIQPVSGTVTANQGTPAVVGNGWPSRLTDAAVFNTITTVAGKNGIDVNLIGTPATGAVVKELRAATSAVTSVAASAVNVTLLAANANRLGLRITNDGNQILYVKFGVTASATSFTVKMIAGAFLEEIQWVGQVDGIWDVANGSARITELTQ